MGGDVALEISGKLFHGSVKLAILQTLHGKKSGNCEADLDRMLWVVLKRKQTGWTVKHMQICAAEPPYWYLEQYGGLVWPCGVYKGLLSSGPETLEAQCRRQRSSPYVR